MAAKFFVGTAGWSIRKEHAAAFPGDGSHLERYARQLNAVEINSSFYRPHKPSTYARWAASVPAEFRFAVKMPREITHKLKLAKATAELDRFFGEVAELGRKLGPVLVQLPPSLRYDDALVRGFFDDVRARFKGEVVCEPRHRTWFTDDVDLCLAHLHVARVAADPAVVPRAGEPGGWPKIVYRRLHGAPKIYYSPYSAAQITEMAATMTHPPARTRADWCIFDNTALGEATKDAFSLLQALNI